MANSRDPRRPTRWHRGDKRYGNVGGHSPPGDDLENTRDHERIWFELRRTRGCCGCDHPGLKYCFETADYPTLVCEGFYPSTFSLIDYYPGLPLGAATDDLTLAQGCGGSEHTLVEGFSVFTEFEPDGSWRNGPIFGKRGFGGNGTFQGTSTGWPDQLWMDFSHSFEYFIKPSSTDIALSKSLTASGPFMNLGDGGYFTSFSPGGAIAASHITDSAISAQGVIVADQWHHIVYVRNIDDESFSIWVNGRRVVRIRIPISDINGGTEFVLNPDTLFTFALGEGSWSSDVSRYTGPMPPSEIRRRARVMLGIVGLPEGGEDDPSNPDDGGVIIEDPTFLIDDLAPDQITSEGEAGNVMMSDSESAYWETPENSPFELEARKGQTSGYASLDATTKVPTAELGTGTADDTTFLRGDRTWHEGELIPGPPTDLDQMVRAEPAGSAEYVAYLDDAWGNASEVHHYPLTESGEPFGKSLAPTTSHGTLSGDYTVVDDPNDYVFAGETVVHFAGGTDGLVSASSPTTDWGRLSHALWMKVDAYPASDVQVLHYSTAGLKLRSDGNLCVWKSTNDRAVTSVPIPLDEWVHVIFGNDGAGGGTGTKIWVNGVAAATGSGDFGTLGGQALRLAGDGFEGAIAHVTQFAQEWVTRLDDADALALYELRRPVWTIVDTGLTGIDVAEEDVTITPTLRPEVNFRAGANIVLAVTDDPANNRVDVDIAASTPAGSGFDASENGTPVTAAPRGRYNFLDGFGTYWDLTDDAGNDEVEIVVNLPDASGASIGDVLTLDGSMEPGWDTPSGGGGGGGWDSVLNLPLTVTTNWAMPAGWSNDGTKHIVGVNTPQTRNKYNVRVPQAGVIYEVEIQLPSSSRSAADQRAGIVVNWDGTNTGAALYMLKWAAKAAGVVTVERDAVAAGVSVTPSGGLALDTWHTLRICRYGIVADLYVNGTYAVTQRIDAHAGAQFEHSYIALYGYQIDAWFRNLKVWTLAQP